MPEVSIITPAYNAARYLRETVQSALAQTFVDWELIVVDDGSQDRTASIVRDMARLDGRIRLVQQANAGVAAARNRGLAAASPASWAVLFLDADDVLEPRALQLLVTALRTAPPTSVGAHGLVCLIDDDGQRIRPGEAEETTRDRRALVNGRVRRLPTESPTTLAVLAFQNSIRAPGSVLVRRTEAEAVGGFDLDRATAIAGDWDLWLRLACRGDLEFVDEVVLRYRVGSGGMSQRSSRASHRAIRYVRHKFASRPELTEEQRQLVRTTNASRYLLSSQDWWRWARTSLAQRRPVMAANQVRHSLIELACGVLPARAVTAVVRLACR